MPYIFCRQNAEIREGRQITLISEAQNIPSAVDRILQSVTGGWSYVGV
ncbi:MAG TPA: hypothetical protein VIM41_03285 [Gammaproteobacteria bacterium]